MAAEQPPVFTGNVVNWAKLLTGYLARRSVAAVQLPHMVSGEKATVDGILMWNPTTGKVVVSSAGAWVALH